MPDPRRILVVEDDDAARHALRMVLEEMGHTVEEADDGVAGLGKAVSLRPDVCIVDIEMPIVDGYGFARRVRECLGGSVRLIALTGHDHPERAIAAGFDTHLLKPADPEEVRRLVDARG